LTEIPCCYHSWVSNSFEVSLSTRHGLPNSKPHRTVFLDRDGVINRKMPEGQYVTGWQHFELLPGVPESIVRLNQAGLRVLVVTNQRGIALGLYSVADVEHIHQQLQLRLSSLDAHVDGFYFCPHDKRECTCRKPLPGLFEQAQADFPDIDAGSSLIIGDSLSDIEFGRNIGMYTIFLEGDEYARQHQKPGTQRAVALADNCFATLPDAVESLMQTRTLRDKS
jgi:D-glycero-D-manno-heptose 1,7-bisphosphate phosphatase